MSEAPIITANKEGWETSQTFELSFWKDNWIYRDLPIEEMRERRHLDAKWFLEQFGIFPDPENPYRFSKLTGRVLEVGCGPIGIFEKCQDVDVVGQDTLMNAYARELSYSTLGKRGATTYVGKDISEFQEKFDTVVCTNVLDHTADWVEFTQHLGRLVAPGGQLLLFTDSRGSPVLGHTQIFTGEQVGRVLRLMGAKDIPVFRIDREPPGEHCDYRNFISATF